MEATRNQQRASEVKKNPNQPKPTNVPAAVYPFNYRKYNIKPLRLCYSLIYYKCNIITSTLVIINIHSERTEICT